MRARIATTGRDPESIRIVAVTKTFGVDAVRAARGERTGDLGENYVDELCAKRAQSGDARPSRGTTSGALQSNKVHRVVACADVMLWRRHASKELERIATFEPRRRLYVQVDYTGSPGRNGAAPAESGGPRRSALASSALTCADS